LKVITEAILRDELRASQPESYTVPEGKILSPAAREYLQQRKIKIIQNIAHSRYAFKPRNTAEAANPVTKSSIDYSDDFAQNSKNAATSAAPSQGANAAPACVAKFIDFESGAFYAEKPEYMTQLHGNLLVPKDHARIRFRGMLDSLQALVVLIQTIVGETGGSRKLLDDLNDILGVLRDMMRCDVLDEPFNNERIIGLTHAELRERSHNPMKFFSVKQMVLPDYSLGKVYALLNQLRTSVRETEVSAVRAFRVRNKYERKDIVEGLNRLSSAVHIMMCMYLADEYKK
jgi:ethanolamine utilization cobalamin adenosyltransferase